MTDFVTDWQPYAPTHPQHSVVGTLLVLPRWYSPQLQNDRAIYVWLPPAYYTSAKRFPVIYMHDAQNVFDRHTSFGGEEWEADETLTRLSAEGREAIVVALPHMEKERLREYNPFPKVWRGRGHEYAQFIVETVKPKIDQDFRTRPERAATGLVGSSMGGLISLYAFFAYPNVFSFVGAMSPAFWVAHGSIYAYVRNAPYVPGRIYLDHGTLENTARRMQVLLEEKGYHPPDTLKYVREEGGEHRESAWARRLPEALRFLLP
jgi:predicted alpha/beta superfamily hydrolase